MNRRGEKAVQFHTPESHGFVSVDVKEKAEDQDSVFFLQLSDTPFMENLELSFVVINDPGESGSTSTVIPREGIPFSGPP